MSVISWDVGIINLAYCIISIKDNKILDWDIINLLEQDRQILECCGELKNGSHCGKKATYSLHVPGYKKILGFCKTHIRQSELYWEDSDNLELFESGNYDCCCNYINKKGAGCKSKAKFYYNHKKKYLHHKKTSTPLFNSYPTFT